MSTTPGETPNDELASSSSSQGQPRLPIDHFSLSIENDVVDNADEISQHSGLAHQDYVPTLLEQGQQDRIAALEAEIRHSQYRHNYPWSNLALQDDLKKSKRNTLDHKYENSVLARTANTDAAEILASVETKLKVSYDLIDINVWDNQRLYAENNEYRELFQSLRIDLQVLAQKLDVWGNQRLYAEDNEYQELFQSLRVDLQATTQKLDELFEERGSQLPQYDLYSREDVKKINGRDGMKNRGIIGAPSLKAMASRSLATNLLGYASSDVEYPTSTTLPTSNLDWLKIPQGYNRERRTPFAVLKTLEMERPAPDPPSAYHPPSPNISFPSSTDEGRREEWDSTLPSLGSRSQSPGIFDRL